MVACRATLTSIAFSKSSTAVSPAEPCILDSQVYPHIIDCIIKHAGTEVLRAFSLTAKAYRDAYPKLAGRHLIMQNGEVPRIVLVSHRGSLSIRAQPVAKLKAFMKRSAVFFQHCTTLDVKDDIASYLQFTLVLRQLKTLRLFLNPGGFRNALPHLANTSIILFGAYPFYNMSWSGDNLWYGPTLYLKEKVVWNVTDFYCPDARSNHVDLRRVKEFVLHFNISPNARLKKYLVAQITETLVPILQRSACYDTPLVFKLVGFDDLPLDVNFVRAADSAESRNRRTVLELGNVADRVVFMTSEEYCAEVGRETFEVETSEHLW